ncbi:MAG: DUF3488 and transglutaminase-like domain-containing protein [Neisseria sp.]|nr:DUF3488 and transglutaminase-like domain-containing protein [Neisseria sp.]
MVNPVRKTPEQPKTTMLILNPSFLQKAPPAPVAAAVLLALAWTSLPLLSTLPLPVIAVFGVLWLIRLFLLQLETVKLPLPVLILMMTGVGFLVWQQLGTIIGRDGGISFLLLMVMLKSFESGNLRDWQVLLLAMLFLTGSAVLFSQTLLIGLWLLLALLAVSLCFALLSGIALRPAIRQSLFAFGLTMPLMAVLFVVIPRKSEPLWRVPQKQNSQAKTGLSDTMSPGSVSNLVQTNELVANVIFEDGQQPAREQLYWRAIIMSDFDGKTWHSVPEKIDTNTRPSRATGRRLSYEMILRDQNGIVPALDYPYSPDSRNANMRLGNVIRVRSREGLRRVKLESQAADTLPQKLTDFEKRYYLYLPPGGNFRTRQLARLLAGQSTNARQLSRQILNYFRNEKFSYTLQPPLFSGNDSIDEFMFNGRQGFCEHYAQSYVVMMRAAGIPARIVTGYLGGDYQESGNFWQIRSKDAHAWAEIWLEDEQAWLRVDPTTAASAQRLSGLDGALSENERNMISGGGKAGFWTQWLESGQFYWQQWVINYDESSQNNLFAKIGLGGFNFNTGILAGGVGLLAALLPVAFWWKRGRRREQQPLTEGFLLLKETLLGSEAENLPSVTARELLALMRQNQINDEQLKQLLKQYEDWQFASYRQPDKARQRQWFAKIKKAVRPYRKNNT